MNIRKQISGFTLIELIIVIVILGLLAATAAPRFMGMSSDARIATLKALDGSLKSTAKLVRFKCLVNTECDINLDSLRINMGGKQYGLSYGYPGGGLSLTEGLINDHIDTPDFTVSISDDTKNTVFAVTNAPDPATCSVHYIQAYQTIEQTFSTEIFSEGC